MSIKRVEELEDVSEAGTGPFIVGRADED